MHRRLKAELQPVEIAMFFLDINSWSWRLSLLLLVFLHGDSSPTAAPPVPAPANVPTTFAKEVRPLLVKYCAACHGAKEPAGGLDMAVLDDEQRRRSDRRLLTKLAIKLRDSKMPPRDEARQPSSAERQRLVAWVESMQDSKGSSSPDPGHVVMRRLTRYEYANTVRDLFTLGAKKTWRYFVAPGTEFPKEGIQYTSRTLKLPWNLPPDEVDYGFDNIGEVLTLPPHLMESYFEVADLVVDRVLADKKARPAVLPVRPGADKSEKDAARDNLATLAQRAFRRPVTNADVQPLVDLFSLARARVDSFDEAMKVPLKAMLVAPDFLFHVERVDPRGRDTDGRPLNDYELACRLSYFLWSSMPDAELFRLAAQAKLTDPAVLEQQVRRMLRDPKVEALAEHFAPQWLQIENIQAVMPNPELFPVFYRGFTGVAMRMEAIMFFDSVVIQDRRILDLIDSDSTFLNERLAELYGIIKKAKNGLQGFGIWRRYELPEKRRGGVLTMAAVAVVTATPTRSSPVKRGKWVLETILGDPPAPPPPNVEELKEDTADQGKITFRQKLEKHRANATCAACHQAMDPLGFSLENLDAIGRWRERDGIQPVDATGLLKDGTTLQGAAGLKAHVLHCKDDFARCFTEHLLTYALGRKREWYDQTAVEQIVKALRHNDYRFSTLVVEIAKSRPFRYTR